MAVRKRAGRGGRTGRAVRRTRRAVRARIFPVILAAAFIGLFAVLLPAVRRGASGDSPRQAEGREFPETAGGSPVPENPALSPPPGRNPERPPESSLPENAAGGPASGNAGTAGSALPAPPPVAPAPATTVPVPSPDPVSLAGSVAASSVRPENPPPPETRERVLYFMRAENDGADLVPARADRRIPVSDAPLRDSLSALLSGPTEEEKRRGLISFIPPGTRLISVRITGSTAYVNLSEDFRFNTGGREGLAAGIRQTVLTATEFASVRDVQFLIEGNRLDFLNDGVAIGSPIGR